MVYLEKLIELCTKAFVTQEQFAQNQAFAVGYFVDGLRDERIKFRLMRTNPQDLQTAINMAITELNLAKRFKLRNEGVVHEPMDVDQTRSRPKCYKCHRVGHKANVCRALPPRPVNVVQGPPNEQRCWKCGSRNQRMNCK